MKRAIIVHYWGGNPNYCWYPYAKRELEKFSFAVDVPAMPNTDKPNLSVWLPVLKEAVGEPGADTYLIGHSVGVITILRYLESLSPEQKIGGAILVAGFTDNLGYEELNNFFEMPINFTEIKKHCTRFVAIHSNNDPYVAMKYADVFEEKLGAERIIKEKMRHFSGLIDNEESCTELPEVVRRIKLWAL